MFQKFGRFCQKGKIMTGAAVWASALVERERRDGRTKLESIRRAARRAHVSPGQIEGLLRGRVKDPRASLVERLRAAFITETAREIERLRHEILLAGEAGVDADESTLRKARLAVAALDDLLSGEG